ncbi:glycosyltransferase [Kocuria palustris]|uniref:glycosyltransferase n=1 Tax=Kocuria palustris TaxID=71999 RepID=UPI0011AAAD88|nr:glycosyltransferase family 4 protein [Kocuria palustris]
MSTAVRDRSVLRVAPVPAHHPYVEAVTPFEAWDGVERFVPPEVADLPPGRWRPHPLLDAQRLREAADELDVLHVHFGFEHRSPQQIRALARQCRESGIRLVLTVHDLQNPHLSTPEQQAEHLERLAALIGAAQTVITLTGSAAREIRERFGREAVVIPHPLVVAPQRAQRLQEQARADGGRPMDAAVFLKDLRAATVRDPGWYRDLAGGLGGRRLTVFVDERAADAEPARDLAGIEGLELVVHPRMDDDELHSRIARCTAVVLPYLRGSHSGWLEMCRDLGAVVAAPDCGHYRDQADRPGAVIEYATGDGRDAARAVREALAAGPLPYAGDRRAQAEQAARAHRRLLSEGGS